MSQVKSISFCRVLPPSLSVDGTYVFLVLTSAGVLGIWKLDAPNALPKKSKKKKASAKPPQLSPQPDCLIRVARDAAANGSDVESGGILAASFCSSGEVMVAYGNEVKPTFSQVRLPDAIMLP